MTEKIQIHKRNIKARLESLKEWKTPEENKEDLILFLQDLEIGKVNRGKRISEGRRLKYLDMLKITFTFWNKDLSQIELKDIEDFERAISSDQILSFKKKPFSNESKRDIKIALKIYIKWKLGEAKALELCDWLDTRRIAKTPDYMKESEVMKLYKSCKNAKERYLLALLFDSGARAEEFINIRYEDVEIPEKGDSFVKITLKEEYSKTKGRVISLYWKHSLEAVRDYLRERELNGLKSTDPVFEGSYNSARFFLMRTGKKILNKSIHFHLFRHSSATYYASKLNRQELCYRYGWRFSSEMPDTYISRAGMQSKELDEKFSSTEMENLQKKVEKQEQERLIEVERQNDTEALKKKIEEEVWERLVKTLQEGIDSGRIVIK
ncbi:site-specific integrase [archaeon]|jgi:integrase/recombinase XerD|nr:site-specific integrase [archaeon]